jgi:hypothetical protein
VNLENVQQQEGVKRTVRFSSEDYPAIVKAVKSLGENLILVDLDRKVGYVHLVVRKGTSLEAFSQFQKGEGGSMDRHLKVQLTPYTREGSGLLREILNGFVLGDYAESIAKHVYKKGEHLTVRFTDLEPKNDFIAKIKGQFPGDITVRG